MLDSNLQKRQHSQISQPFADEVEIEGSHPKRSKNSTFDIPKRDKSSTAEQLPPKRELKIKSDDEGEEFLILPQGPNEM